MRLNKILNLEGAVELSTNKQKNIVMIKNILNLEGAYSLTESEQKNIKGGQIPPDGQCGEFVVFYASEAQCLAYPRNLRPAYIGENQCSILMAPC